MTVKHNSIHNYDRIGFMRQPSKTVSYFVHGNTVYYHTLTTRLDPTASGKVTNLKVGAHVRRTAQEFFVAPLHFFGSINAISRFGERFRGGQYSFVTFLFVVVLLTAPPCQAICKNGDAFPVPHGATATNNSNLDSLRSICWLLAQRPFYTTLVSRPDPSLKRIPLQ